MSQSGLQLNPFLNDQPRAIDPPAFEPGPDAHSATDKYAERFASSVGSYFLQTQLMAVQRLLEPWPNARVLDVGGGHAQIAPELVAAGHDVTIHGSTEACRERPDRLIGPANYQFLQGDLLHLPAEDQSYDVVIAVRMMSHISDPLRLISELSRVARHAVVLDFSAHVGVMHVCSKASFRVKKWAENNSTRQYNNHNQHDVEGMFRGFGLTPDQSIAQYFLPMVAHRKLHCAPISRGIEAVAKITGLTRRFGSPVLLRARR